MSTKTVMRQHWRDELDIWASPIFANMLWVLISIPVLTMPLAMVGLLACMYHWVDKRHTQIFTIFFRTIRKTWWKCYMLAALDVVIGGFLIVNMLIFFEMDMSQVLPRLSLGATMLTFFIFVIANVPAWVMVAVLDVPLKTILRFAVQFVFLNTVWTTLIGVGFIASFLFSLILPAAVYVTVTGAVAAAIAARGTRYLMMLYLSPNQYPLIELS